MPPCPRHCRSVDHEYAYMNEYVTCMKVNEVVDLLAKFAAKDGDDVARSAIETVHVVNTEVGVRLCRHRCQRQASLR